jgi:hypothetical protein
MMISGKIFLRKAPDVAAVSVSWFSKGRGILAIAMSWSSDCLFWIFRRMEQCRAWLTARSLPNWRSLYQAITHFRGCGRIWKWLIFSV